MDERGFGYGDQPDDDLDWSPRSRGAEPGSLSRGPQSGSQAPRRRTGLIVGAVVAAAAVGVGAAYAGGVFKKGDASPAAGSSPTTSATGGAAATSQSSTVTTGAPPSAAISSPSTAGTPAVIAPAAGAKNVGTFYNFADAALTTNAPKPDPTALGSVFASKSVQAKYWNSNTNKAQTSAMCGAKQPTLAIVAPSANGATVSFYEQEHLAAQQAHVILDGNTQKISSITCVKSVAPTFVATRKVLQFYGAPPGMGTFPTSSKTYAPASANGPGGAFDIEPHVCAQYGPQSWVFYAPMATTSGDAWQFFYDGGDTGGVLFTDPTTGDFERTVCGGFPSIPAPDQSAAGKERDPASLLVLGIYDAYLFERSQQSAGAVPLDEIAPYFASAEVYQAAQKSTGKFPFLCASKAPRSVKINRPPSVAGGVETLSLTVVYADSPVPDAPSTPVGKLTVSMDLSTMKIKALTCG